MTQNINIWRADHLMTAANRLEIHIKNLQAQADEYRELARKVLAQAEWRRSMSSDYDRFRARWGVSPMQHEILKNMKNGEIRHHQAGGNGGVQQLHRLKERGILECVGENSDDRFWRLTDEGRRLVASWC